MMMEMLWWLLTNLKSWLNRWSCSLLSLVISKSSMINRVFWLSSSSPPLSNPSTDGMSSRMKFGSSSSYSEEYFEPWTTMSWRKGFYPSWHCMRMFLAIVLLPILTSPTIQHLKLWGKSHRDLPAVQFSFQSFLSVFSILMISLSGIPVRYLAKRFFVI